MLYGLKITDWDKICFVPSHNLKDGGEKTASTLKVGDKVLLKTSLGIDLAEVVSINGEESFSCETGSKQEAVILRKATKEDIRKDEYLNQKKKIKQAIKESARYVKELNLPMKIIGAHFSFDGGRVTIFFTAPERIDFRELVKALSSHFHKSIRLYQVGVRQVFELEGDIGPCGYPLCCRCFLRDFDKVSIKAAVEQNLAHRGMERLTGVCGRLKCCLLFEQNKKGNQNKDEN